MKIYFAGSIRGGRNDKELYAKIIELLKQNYGDVLTEHIGYLDLSHLGEDEDPTIIYNRDLDWLKESDVVIAEVTTPSLGVGYELGTAESLKKKTLCLYRKTPEKSLSAMITGNKHFKIEYYNELSDLGPIFDKFLR